MSAPQCLNIGRAEDRHGCRGLPFAAVSEGRGSGAPELSRLLRKITPPDARFRGDEVKETAGLGRDGQRPEEILFREK